VDKTSRTHYWKHKENTERRPGGDTKETHGRRRNEAEGKRKEAGGRKQEEGGKKQEVVLCLLFGVPPAQFE